MSIRKIFTTFIILTISILGFSQDIEKNKEEMNRILNDSENYLHWTSRADSVHIAVNDAVGMLATQIVRVVRAESTESSTLKSVDGDFSEETYYSNIVKTFTDVTLKDYHVLITDKPNKKKKEYEVFVYISSDKVEEILDEMKRAEEEAAAERFNKLKNDVLFYYEEGLRAIDDVRIGDALKNLYWAYILSTGSKVTIESGNANRPAEAVISTLIDQTLDAITITCEAQKEEKVNESQTSFIKELSFRIKQGDTYKRITCLDFKYNNGYTFVSGPRVRDGISQADLGYNMNHLEIHCVYNYDESETPHEVYEAMSTKQFRSFSAANKSVDLSKKQVELAEDITETKNESDIAEEQPIVEEQPVAAETSTPMIDSARLVRLYEIMGEVEDAIRHKRLNMVSEYFTDNGYECYNKLIKYGSATIIGTPHYEFIPFGDIVICESITMRFRFKSNKQFVENVNFRFNSDDMIESLAFSLTDVARHDILDNVNWKMNSKLTLLTFMEDYQTAYALKRLDYLEKIFSENALIISGYKIMKKANSDGIRLNGYTHYDTLTKSQYINKLRGFFKSKEYINLNFSETEFDQAGDIEDFFGVRVRQEYFSNTYGDVGYLFLLVDLRDEDPIIHVRAWQEDKLPLDKLFGLKDVY